MAGLFEFLCILFNNFSQVVHSKIHELSSSCKVKYYLKTVMDQAGVEHNVFTSFKPCFLIILLYLSTYVCNCNTTFKYTLPAMLSLFKTLLSIQVYLCQVWANAYRAWECMLQEDPTSRILCEWHCNYAVIFCFIFHDTYTFNIQGNKKTTAASKPTNMHAWLIIRALYLLTCYIPKLCL